MDLTISPLLLILISLITNEVNSDCRQSFITICDDIADIKKSNKSSKWTELLIGSEDASSVRKEKINMMHFPWTLLPRVRSLFIINKIEELQSNYGFQCTYRDDVQLKFVSYYGNNFKSIASYYFPLIPLKKLSLVNNNIETIDKYTFEHHKIEVLDLSDNHIETIEYSALPLEDDFREFIARNNKISHIEPGSFYKSLEKIFLDNNLVRVIDENVLKPLSILQELNLSHNKLRSVIYTRTLNELKALDLSFNEINHIATDAFNTNKKLTSLDLTHNKLSSFNYILPLLSRAQPQIDVSIALNYYEDANDLKNLQNNTSNHHLLLYGNPWDCNKFEGLKAIIVRYQQECDRKFLTSGKAPFCLNYQSVEYPLIGMKRVDQVRLQEAVMNEIDTVDCQLSAFDNSKFYPMVSGCVA